MERKLEKEINSLGEYGRISFEDAAPFPFDYLVIERNSYYDCFTIGWDYNYGCARQCRSFKTAKEAVEFLKEKKINLHKWKRGCDPCLFNGL